MSQCLLMYKNLIIKQIYDLLDCIKQAQAQVVASQQALHEFIRA